MVGDQEVPIPRDVIEQQFIEHVGKDVDGADDWGLSHPTDEDVDRVIGQIDRIQSFVADNLRTLLGKIYSPHAKGPLEVIHEDPECYYIGDHDGCFYHQIVSRVGPIDDETRDAHSLAVHKALHPHYDFDGEDMWLIKKPNYWKHAQWTTDSFFTGLMECGVSPTQALDYWMVEVRGKGTGVWSQIRDTSSEAIRQNVKKTKEALDENNGDADIYTRRTDYFKRTYTGRYNENGRNDVRADYGYLDPRHDIARIGRTGFTWGYRGAGPTQLAYALLADATGNSDIPTDLHSDFVSMMNSAFGNREWEITAEEIRDWVRDHDEEMELK